MSCRFSYHLAKHSHSTNFVYYHFVNKRWTLFHLPKRVLTKTLYILLGIGTLVMSDLNEKYERKWDIFVSRENERRHTKHLRPSTRFGQKRQSHNTPENAPS